TGEFPAVPALAQQQIHAFTDLLLHDMGDELADGRPDFEALGTEWRTPPLWGVGLTPVVNRHTRFLHDGRARSLEEAVLWHGGEARAARDRFMALPRPERRALLNFLESL
ncbi:MAG TPA: di-heme oxidoredictase family protein, partial [Steroidobacteraceae bacterium]|nr:di-heme oxidoredictase family protein [Steroidobacteraceae bacterium]